MIRFITPEGWREAITNKMLKRKTYASKLSIKIVYVLMGLCTHLLGFCVLQHPDPP